MFKVRTQAKSQYQLYKRNKIHISYIKYITYIWTSLSAYNVNHRRIMQHVQFAVRINVFRFVFLTFYIYGIYAYYTYTSSRFFVRCFLPKSKVKFYIYIYIYIFIYIYILYEKDLMCVETL